MRKKVESSSKTFDFTRVDSHKILKLEEKIAYLYGALNTEQVIKYYMQAIHILEVESVRVGEENLYKKMLPLLMKAYEEIQKQTTLHFDTEKAASMEFQLILAQATRTSFEKIYNIMVNLYGEVFQTKAKNIEKAAMLRTFLYQYKIRLLCSDEDLSDEDIDLMVKIAERSKKELNQLV